MKMSIVSCESYTVCGFWFFNLLFRFINTIKEAIDFFFPLKEE